MNHDHHEGIKAAIAVSFVFGAFGVVTMFIVAIRSDRFPDLRDDFQRHIAEEECLRADGPTNCLLDVLETR